MSKRGRQELEMPSMSDVAPKYRRVERIQKEMEPTSFPDGTSPNHQTEGFGIRPNLGSQRPQNPSNFQTT